MAIDGRLERAVAGRGGGRLVCRFGLARGVEERAGERELGGPMAVGEEADVADAMEAVGQGVEEEAPDELVRGQPHDLGGAVLAVVLPGEGDVVLVAGDEPAIGDGDAMGVAAEIGEHLGGAAEGLLGIDDPVDPPQGWRDGLRTDPARRARPDRRRSAAPFVEGGGEPLEEQPAEQPGERLHGQEEVGLAMDPARCRPATGRRRGRRSEDADDG